MKVAVKKRVLFNLLKNRLNENRMHGGDLGGRVIHPFNIQSPNSDPFGFYEDEEDTPIKVSDHMATQLSVPKMPVEDEDFVPSTITELCNSSILICKEVPIEQIEYFYRQLHMLLDRCLDRNDERGLDVVNESFEISKKTTIRDFNIIAESAPIRRRQNLHDDAMDSDAYNEAENKEAFLNGYRAAMKEANPSEEHAQQISMGSQDFIKGYMQAVYEDNLDFEDGLEVFQDEELDRPLFPARPGEEKTGTGKPLFDSWEQFLARGVEIDPVTGDIDTSEYDNASPQEKASMDASAALQQVFKAIHNEATAIMMDPATAKEFGAMMTPVTQELGLSSGEILTPLNVGRAFSYVNSMKDQTKKLAKIQELQMKFFVIVSESLDKVLGRKPRIKGQLKQYASEANIPFDQFLVQLKQDISGAYTKYGATSRIAAEGGDSAVVTKGIDDLFSVFVKTLKLPGTDNKFKDRSHFARNVDINSMEEILDGFKALVDNQFKDNTSGMYVVRDRDAIVGVDEQEMMGLVETFINTVFEDAEETQSGPVPPAGDEIDVSDETTDQVEEVEAEEYMTALEQFAARHAQGKAVDFQDLAPYFGYSGSAGMRQYFLKDIQPKLQAMSFTDADGVDSNIGDLMDFNAEVLVDQMLVVINKPNTGLIAKYEKLVAKGNVKKRQVNAKNKVQNVGTVETLEALKNQIVPVLETLQQLFNQGDKFTEIAASPTHPAHEILNLVGGFVFREVNNAPIDAVLGTMRGDLNDAIADSIISRVGPGKVSKSAIVEKGGIAEYFTGLKTTPDYAAPTTSKKGKIVQKLIAIGLTPEVFAEVLVEAEETWQDGILDKLQDFDGAIYKEAIENAVDDLTDNPANLMKAIEAGIKATAQEKVYRDMESQVR